MAGKARKVFIRILVVLAGVVTGLCLVRAVFNYTTGKALEKYLARAKADGVPLRMEDIAPRCPDSDNGARPWKAAEAVLIPPGEKERKLVTDAINGLIEGKRPDQASMKTLRPLCDKNRRVFELMAEAAAKPCFKYGDWTKGPWSVETIKAVKALQAVRLLCIDAMLRADDGHIEEALQECRNGRRFVLRLMDEPLLINNLVALGEMKMLVSCLEEIASGRELDEATLSAWLKEMEPVPWRRKFVRWIPVERAVGLDWGLMAVGGGRGDLSYALAVLGAEKPIERLFYWLIRPVLKSQVIWVHERYRELDGRVDVPYYKQAEFLDWVRRAPWYYRVANVLLPDFRSVFLKEASLEALMLATQAGLACKIYKVQNGRYPASLEALVPGILTEVPLDPFTGKPLVFRVKDGELLIYSLGSNQRDDGGRSSLITQLVMDKDDDWAWREKTK